VVALSDDKPFFVGSAKSVHGVLRVSRANKTIVVTRRAFYGFQRAIRSGAVSAARRACGLIALGVRRIPLREPLTFFRAAVALVIVSPTIRSVGFLVPENNGRRHGVAPSRNK